MKNFIFRSTVFAAMAVLSSIIMAGTVKAAGAKDATYGTNGELRVMIAGAMTVIHDMVVQPDGKLLVAGAAGGGNVHAFISRYLSNGTIDLNFGSGGVALIPNDQLRVINDIELQADGKILAVGTDAAATTTDFLVLRLASNGTMDNTFGNGGVVTLNQDRSDALTSVAVQSNGKIVAAGWTNDETQPTAPQWVAITLRFNANGTLDPTFNGGGFLYNRLPGMFSPYFYDHIADVEALPDGRILTGGVYTWDRPGEDEIGYYIQMVRANGTPDTDFGQQGVQRYGIFETLGWQSAGFDAEVLTDGTVAIATGTGVISTDLAGYRKYFPQSGSKIVSLANGRVAVGGGAVGAPVRTYSKNAFIGKGWNLVRGQYIAAQPDGKVLVGRFDNETMSTIIYRASINGSQATRQANFNNDDDIADLAVYRASDKTLYSYQPAQSPTSNRMLLRGMLGNFTRLFPEFVQFTFPSTRIHREATVGFNNGATNGGQAFFTFERIPGELLNITNNWGLSTDVPYGGDFNGDGLLDVGVYRPATGVWYGLTDFNFNQQSPTVQWGAKGDKPVPADYDGDGITDYAVYRPINGTWWVHRSSDGSFFVANFGISTDIPLTGDFDGDGKADFTVYRPSEGAWYQYLTTDGFRYNTFGISTDIPVPGDYDGDGKHDIAVYRNGTWYILRSSAGLFIYQWGTTGDVPVTARYDQ